MSIRLRSNSVRTRDSSVEGAWWEVAHRASDWASRSLQREFEEVILVEVLIEEMSGSD